MVSCLFTFAALCPTSHPACFPLPPSTTPPPPLPPNPCSTVLVDLLHSPDHFSSLIDPSTDPSLSLSHIFHAVAADTPIPLTFLHAPPPSSLPPPPPDPFLSLLSCDPSSPTHTSCHVQTVHFLCASLYASFSESFTLDPHSRPAALSAVSSLSSSLLPLSYLSPSSPLCPTFQHRAHSNLGSLLYNSLSDPLPAISAMQDAVNAALHSWGTLPQLGLEDVLNPLLNLLTTAAQHGVATEEQTGLIWETVQACMRDADAESTPLMGELRMIEAAALSPWIASSLSEIDEHYSQILGKLRGLRSLPSPGGLPGDMGKASPFYPLFYQSLDPGKVVELVAELSLT